MSKEGFRLNWELFDSKYVLRDKWISVRADTCRMPSGRIVKPFYVVEYPTWVAVVALTPDRDIVLVRQYRHGIGEVTLELPAGMVDRSDASPESAIERELLEETGYRGNRFLRIGKFSVNPSNQNNFTITFLAEDVEKVSEPHLDDTEDIEVILVPFRKVFKLVEDGSFFNAAHVASVFLAARFLGLRL